MTPVPYVHFPDYSKSDFVQIQCTRLPTTLPTTTTEDTAELWSRFCGAVHDSLIKSARRTLPAFTEACESLWPRFTAPILAGTHGPREFSKLLIAGRVHFQDEGILDPGLVNPVAKGPQAQHSSSTTQAKAPHQAATTDLSSLLPTTARLLLLASYLASHNATKHDLTLFSTHYHGRKRRRGGLLGTSGPRSKHRKIARKLLGAHAFVLERMLAIFAVVKNEWVANSKVSGKSILDGDVGMALATLASLRLLVKVGGGGDPVDRAGKWKVNVGWEVVRALGRSMGVEVADWLID
jgi:origin recognition complex subunit 5